MIPADQFPLELLTKGDIKTLARAITIVENDMDGSNELLEQLKLKRTPVIGITGSPGAGKSSLINALVAELLKNNFRIGVLAVDPTSPFNFGSLLGDRIRLAEHFNHPNVFIRSLASRGSVGGLSDRIMEVTDLMRTFPFDWIFIETVGVGQSEVEIAGLADTTIVVLNPESGDEIQTMKAGLMEIADIFVVNKADHPGADVFVKNLRTLSASRSLSFSPDYGEALQAEVPVIKTVAIENKGIADLIQHIDQHQQHHLNNSRKAILLAEKAWRIIQKKRMADLSRDLILKKVTESMEDGNLNVYRFAREYDSER